MEEYGHHIKRQTLCLIPCFDSVQDIYYPIVFLSCLVSKEVLLDFKPKEHVSPYLFVLAVSLLEKLEQIADDHYKLLA